MDGSVLALNAGSSSLKCALYAGSGPQPRELARAQIDTQGVGSGPSGYAGILAWAESVAPGRLSAVGHRVVHGGPVYGDPVAIGAGVVEALEALSPLAPLHQPQSLAAIRALGGLRPGLAQVACFDTAFHRTQPPVAVRLGLPRALHDKGVRRYGFHGLSYEHIACRLAALDPALAAGRVIAAHLGSGASLCAMRDGVSIDTTMGFSPLDGLVMSTRCGALDPAVPLYLMMHEGLGAQQVQDLLYHGSGLLGVSGISGDMKTLLARSEPAALQAVELFVYRAAREASALAGSLGGLDGVVFTGGVGEHSPEIRAALAARLAWLGLELDPDANQGAGERRISAPASRLAAWVIPADEELVIARQTIAVAG